MTSFSKYLLQFHRLTKIALVLTLDICICINSVWIAYYLRLGILAPISGENTLVLLLAICLSIPIFIISGLYRMIFRYAGCRAIQTIIKANLLYAIIYSTLLTVIGFDGVPRTIGIIQPLLLMLGVVASRGLAFFWLAGFYKKNNSDKEIPVVLIYGAGSTGLQLAKAIEIGGQMNVVGFIDDDISLQNSILDGKMIYKPMDLAYLINSLHITVVLLAMPSASRDRRNQILQNISKYKVSVRNLPSLNDIAGGRVTVSDLRELDVEDLLGRNPVTPDPILMKKNIKGLTVLVTGAGGSIGSEICRQIIQNQPSKVVLIDQSEHSLYQIHQELSHHCENNKVEIEVSNIIPIVGSIQDERRMNELFRKYRPDTVFHTAAYKHVPLVEINPFEAVKNNIFGTQILSNLAFQSNVKNFVLISTDKAVRPTNIMGATKRVAEQIIQAMAATNYGETTCFSIVRFGNVLDSSGSVVPKFREQIKSLRPITITDIEVTRYFMTIPEAAQLVIQASSMAIGGEVFVLDMGEPVKILDLATRMIQLSGLSVKSTENPYGDIEINVIGLRRGEKLHEELLIGNNPIKTKHIKIMMANESFTEMNLLESNLNKLKEITLVGQTQLLYQILSEMDIGYIYREECANLY